MANKKGRKAAKKLRARTADYTNTSKNKNSQGYHCPGSNKK